MNDLGRFLAWTRDGIEEVRYFAHRGGCFIHVESFDGWPDAWMVTVWCPASAMADEADARSYHYLGLLPQMGEACFWEPDGF